MPSFKLPEVNHAPTPLGAPPREKLRQQYHSLTPATASRVRHGMPLPLAYSPAAPKRLRMRMRFGVLVIVGGVSGFSVWGAFVFRPAARLPPAATPRAHVLAAAAFLRRHDSKPYDGLAAAATICASILAVALFYFVAPALFRRG